MNGAIVYEISTYLFFALAIISSIYGSYALYYAYVKKKDERENYIVLKSATQSFFIAIILFFVYYVIQISVNVADVSQLTRLWNILHFDGSVFSAGSAVSWMMIIFGISLFLNQKKVGGS